MDYSAMPCTCSRTSQSGFTLIELMMAVAILGVLAALAAPAFNDTIKRYQANAVVDELKASIEVARTEARRRGRTVFLSRHTNASLNCPTSAAAADPWQCWQISIDTNSNQTLDAAEGNAANAAQIFTAAPNYRIQVTPMAININRWGQTLNSPQFLVYHHTDGKAGSSSQTLCLSISGKITHKKGEAVCP
jgi:type IV fimbrial biogenesis protein FimT